LALDWDTPGHRDLTDPDVDFGPAPAGVSDGTPSPKDVESMAQAKAVAAGVALEAAGKRVDWDGTAATVDRLYAGTPAVRLLRAGDLILQVNGRAVDASVEVTRAVDQLPPGSLVTLGIQREGVIKRVQMRTIAPVEGDTSRRSRLGVQLSTIGLRVHLPFDVAIDSGDVVGPSAGLAFALYLYDSISPDDLLQGRHVVATGAISPDGLVLPVGRVKQKVVATVEANRDVLLVPYTNAAEARAAAKEACPKGADCLRVVPVRTMAEAVELLRLTEQELEVRMDSGSAPSA
jgi:PDZ domain-containing protein